MEILLQRTTSQLQMQAYIGILHYLRQDPEASHGLVCLEIMTMPHLCGQWSGFHPLEFHRLFALWSIHHVQVSRIIRNMDAIAN